MYRKLVSPEFRVTFPKQDLQITSGFYVEYQSSDETHADWCILTPYDEIRDLIADADISEAVIEMGDSEDEDYDTILTGYGIRTRESDALLIRDGIWKLEKTTVQAVFIECEPADVVRYILCQCGIEQYQLSASTFGKKDRFAVYSQNAVQALQELNSFWGIDIPFYFKDGTFYWGIEEEQDSYYVLDTTHILDIQQSGKIWTADVVGIPWLHHSQMIYVEDPQYTGMAKIKRCVIKSDNLGIVDMYIQFEEVTDV